MAPVQQLEKQRCSVVCATCFHMALVFAVMHLCNIFAVIHYNFFYCFCTFYFLYTFKNQVLIMRRNGPRYQRVLAVCAFSTGAIPKGFILRKLYACVCMWCFVWICIRTGFVDFGKFVA